MEFFNYMYAKVVSENERNLRFWEEYLKSLKGLDFSLFSARLTVPIMVPVGSKIFFRGELKHTNEITVALGADYFAKCSLEQAEILKQHRIKDAQAKVDLYAKEKEYLQNQISFSKENIYDTVGQEIVEEYSEEEDKIWREKHKQNMKQSKMQSNDNQIKNTITDEELWNRLEELELQEELEQELENLKAKSNEPMSIENTNEDMTIIKENDNNVKIRKNDLNRKLSDNVVLNEHISKTDFLQQIIKRQNELGEMLQEIKQRKIDKSLTEQDLVSKLDEMEQLEELEDEMDRLDDVIYDEDEEYDKDDMEKPLTQTIRRSVMFADEDDSETIEIIFKHSDILPSTVPYDPAKGIQKPSDIYIAFENRFTEETTSILKKKKYECNKLIKETSTQESLQKETGVEYETHSTDRTIVIKDVIERVDREKNMAGYTYARPTSLFKKKRLQNKF